MKRYMVLMPIMDNTMYAPARIEKPDGERALFNGGDKATMFRSRRAAELWIKRAVEYWAGRGTTRPEGAWMVVKLRSR